MVENNDENSGPLTSLPVDRLTATARANVPVLFLTVICTLFVFWLLLYSCPVSESSNYKLGRLDKRKFGTHWLTHSLTHWLTDTTSRAPGSASSAGAKNRCISTLYLEKLHKKLIILWNVGRGG